MSTQHVHAQTTDVSRTKMSLQLVLAGLYPPVGTSLEWNKNLNWQPIPYVYEEMSKDSLLLVRLPCSRYHEEVNRVLGVEVKRDFNNSFSMFEELSNITKWNLMTPDDIQSLYSTLKAEVSCTRCSIERNSSWNWILFTAGVWPQASAVDGKVFSTPTAGHRWQKLHLQLLQQWTEAT